MIEKVKHLVQIIDGRRSRCRMPSHARQLIPSARLIHSWREVVQDWQTPHTFRPCIPARSGVAAFPTGGGPAQVVQRNRRRAGSCGLRRPVIARAAYFWPRYALSVGSGI